MACCYLNKAYTHQDPAQALASAQRRRSWRCVASGPAARPMAREGSLTVKALSVEACEPAELRCAGGSLGPEAALLALCGAAVSGVASGVFGLRGKRLRDAALMGMTAGLAAFFGVALGGSLFALEARAHAYHAGGDEWE